jgi:hypothetical protein
MLPNKDIDPIPPSNTRELREQVDRAKRLAESNRLTPNVGYTIVNTALQSGAIPEPTVMSISRDPGAPLALPFDEKTPPQVDVPNWSMSNAGQRDRVASPFSSSGEFNNQSNADSFYGLTPSKSAED